jgi:diacylglycerol kinase family enzyme
VVILANPRAGSSSSRELVEELVDALHDRGLEPAVCWRRDEFSARLAGIGPGEVRCVVAAGGDGTLVEALNRAPGIPVALLPLGTENLVARHWGIERSGWRVARLIAVGQVRQVDLARISRPAPDGAGERRTFCLMAGIGFDAEVVHRLHRHRSGHISQLSYVWPTVQALRRYPWPALEVEVAETGEQLRGAQVFVFNLPRYGGDLPLAPEARADDGWLNLLVFERPGMRNLFRYLTAVVNRRRNRLRDCQHRLARAVRVQSVPPARVQTDGDPAGPLPVAIEVVPGGMALVVPG